MLGFAKIQKDNGAKYAIATDVDYHRRGYFISFSWNKLLRKKTKKEPMRDTSQKDFLVLVKAYATCRDVYTLT